jgi:hypothetical protein
MNDCRYDGRGEPRTLRGRHGEDCVGDECSGCQPCEELHCVICRRTHAAVTCAECVAATRDDLHMIATLCGSLPAEAEHRGVNGEAMMLLGPSANPEAWRNRATSAIMGRVDAAYLEDCRDEQHPLFVLGTWEQMWRNHLDQPTDLGVTLLRLVDYLDQQMHVMADEEEVPFDDFARDLRGCRGHLQAVLTDQNQGDRANVGCFECGGMLERRLTTQGFEDVWSCHQCRRRYTYAEYNFALRAKLEESA